MDKNQMLEAALKEYHILTGVDASLNDNIAVTIFSHNVHIDAIPPGATGLYDMVFAFNYEYEVVGISDIFYHDTQGPEYLNFEPFIISVNHLSDRDKVAYLLKFS